MTTTAATPAPGHRATSAPAIGIPAKKVPDRSTPSPWPRLAAESRLVTVEGVPILVHPGNGNWVRLSRRGGEVVDALARGAAADPAAGTPSPATRQLLDVLARGGFLAPPPDRPDRARRTPTGAGTTGECATPAAAPAAAPARLGSVLLNLTHRCNLRCQHCAVYADTPKGRPARHLAAEGPGAARGDGRPAEPDGDALLRLLDRLAERGARQLVFFGGEPLVRRDFRRLLDHAAERFPRLGLTTNGTLLTPELCRALVRHRVEVRVSLEGATAEVNDAIRGRGSFARALRGLEALRDAGHPRPAVKCVVNRLNLEDVPRLVKLVRRIGADLEMSFFVALGRGLTHADRLAPSTGQVIEALHRVWLLADYYDVPSATFNAFCRRFMTRAGNGCGAGTGYALVDWTGAVYPCEGMQTEAHRLGSLSDHGEPGSEAGETLAAAPETSVDRSPVCSRCPVRYFCRGGCAAETVAGGRPSACAVYRRLLPPVAARWQPDRGNWWNQRAVFGDDAVDLSRIRSYLV